MKIKLPEPNDYLDDVLGYIDQLELCVFHARKSADKILSKYSEQSLKEGNDTPYITFSSPKITGKLDLIDPDEEWRNDLFIEIVEM